MRNKILILNSTPDIRNELGKSVSIVSNIDVMVQIKTSRELVNLLVTDRL